MRFSASCCAALAMLLPAGLSMANVASQIDYYRDETAAHCPDETELRKAVAARLGYDPFVEWSPRRIVVEINEADSNRLSATIALVEGSGIIKGRSVVSAAKQDCGELVSSIALTIAISLDPDRVLLGAAQDEVGAQQPAEATPPPAPAPSMVATPAKASPAAPADKPGSVQKTPPWLTPALRLSGYRQADVAPSTSWGLRLGASFTHERYVGVVELYADMPNKMNIANANLRTHLLGVDFLPCVKLQDLSLCGSVQMANVWYRIEREEQHQSERAFYLAVGGRAELAIEFAAKWSVFANLDAHRTLTPLSINPFSTVWWKSQDSTFSVGIGIQRSIR